LDHLQQREEHWAIVDLVGKGVGPITSLAMAVTLGQIDRLACSRKVVSCLGLNPHDFA